MLIGNAVHSIDTKGRIVIPAKYREDMGSTVFAFKGLDECIRVYPYEQYKKVIDKIGQGDVKANILRRKIIGSTEQIPLDSQGRILIPEKMRLSVGITDKVRMVGMIDWLELWSEDVLERIEEEQAMTPEEEMQWMADLGLA